MLELSASNIHLNASAQTKRQAIEMAAQALEQAGNVESGYLQGMLGREQQTSTFLGNGIAIPHGTLETRNMVKKPACKCSNSHKESNGAKAILLIL